MKRSNNFMPTKYTRPSEYKVGFNDGYAKGLERSHQLMAIDLTYIYGMLCLHFFEKEGWTGEQVQELVLELQEEWVAESEYEYETRQGGTMPESIPDKVKRITGVDLVQGLGIKDVEVE